VCYTGDLLNSADSHLQEPPDLWIRRLPRALRDRAPRYEYTSTHRVWIAEGRRFATDALAEQAREDGTLVTDDVDRRVKDLDADGVWAETIYGNLGMQCLRFDDAEFAIACSRAYNDYLAEAFSQHRERELPIAVIPVDDVDAAVGEIERVTRLGLRGIALPMTPATPYTHEQYDRIWAAAVAHSLPISFHFGTGVDVSRGDPLTAFSGPATATGSDRARAMRVRRTSMPNVMTFVAQHFVATMVGAGILATYPDLQIVCVEANAGWLAPLMEAMDYAWADFIGARRAPTSATRGLDGWPYPLRPSDYVRRQVKVTFQDEPAPLRFLAVTGYEPLMWGSDFPHPEGTWPFSREVTDALFADVEPAARAAILGGNLARLYGIDHPPGTDL
jgi:predicted TIM-barrel fold metal-dependent hydrolase